MGGQIRNDMGRENYEGAYDILRLGERGRSVADM